MHSNRVLNDVLAVALLLGSRVFITFSLVFQENDMYVKEKIARAG